MSGNNASFYASENSAPESSSSHFDEVSKKIHEPIDSSALGLKARQLAEGGGPLQPPIGETIHGTVKDIEQNTTLGDWGKIVGTGLGLAGLGYLWGKIGSQSGNQQPPNQPPSGPVPPTEPSPIELERLKREQLRTQREELRLQNEQDKIARANAQYEANQAAAQAKRDAAAQQKAAVPPLPDKDAEMLGNSMRAAQQKAIDADMKAQQATQAVAQTTTAEAATSPAIEKAVAPTEQVSQVAAAPVEPPAVNPTAPVEQKTVSGAAKPTQQHTFATAAEATAKNPDMVFIPKAGGADNWLEKQFGPETRKHIRDLFNEGQHYGGGQSAMDKAYADVKQYGQWLKENVPVQTLDRDERKALGVPPLKEYPTLGKAAKVAGVAGILATAAQAANAAQEAKKGNYSSGNELIFNLLGAIPGLGTAFNAGTYSGGLNEGEEKELAKRRGMAPTIR